MNANTTTLPELNGTEKQVAWATEIRAAIIRDMEANKIANPVAYEMLAWPTEARWWIELDVRGVRKAIIALDRILKDYPAAREHAERVRAAQAMTNADLDAALNKWDVGEAVPEADIDAKAVLDAEYNRRMREVCEAFPVLTFREARANIIAKNIANAAR